MGDSIWKVTDILVLHIFGANDKFSHDFTSMTSY